MGERPDLKFHIELYDALLGEHLYAEAQKIYSCTIQRKKKHKGQRVNIEGDVQERCSKCGYLIWGKVANITGANSICYIMKPIKMKKDSKNKK